MWRIAAQARYGAFNGAPIQLHLAFKVRTTGADRIAKLCHGIRRFAALTERPDRKLIRRDEVELRARVEIASPLISLDSIRSHSPDPSAQAMTRRQLCGGSWSTHASCGPRDTMPGPKRVKTQVRSIEPTPSSHFMCKTVPAGGASAACARSRKPGDALQGALTKSATALTPTSAAQATISTTPPEPAEAATRAARSFGSDRASEPQRGSLASSLARSWTPARKCRKRSSSSTQINSFCRENDVSILGEFALRAPARPVQPRAHRPEWDIKRGRDLLVAQLGERIKEQRISLPRAHLCKRSSQPSTERRPVDTSGCLILVANPLIDSAAAVRAQLPALRAPTAAEKVGRDPEEPRQNAPPSPAARAALESERERLRCQVISEIRANPSMDVAVDDIEVPVEDLLERRRLPQRDLHDLRIRRN